MYKKVFAFALLFGLVLYGVLSVAKPEQAEIQEPGEVGTEIGNRAPGFTLPTITGESLSLAELRGQKVILNFWASWCGPCKAEIPEMIDFYEEASDDYLIIGVNMTKYEKKHDDVEAFINQYQIPFPIVLDATGKVSDDLYSVIAIPTTYFIDTNGTIQEKITGPMTKDMMETAVSKLQ